MCHACHDVTEQVRGLATTGQLQYFDINPRTARSESGPGPGPPLSAPARPQSAVSRLIPRVRPGPCRVTRAGSLTPGPGRESERDLMRVRGPDIKFISRVGWTNQSAAFPGAWCQPGHPGQCGASIRHCLINLIGFVSALRPQQLGSFNKMMPGCPSSVSAPNKNMISRR